MAWYEPLLEVFWKHLTTKHIHSVDMYILGEEYDMQQQYLMYENFQHGGLEIQTCPFVGCNWTYKFTINYDLLTQDTSEEEE